ncbi:hypothetical protein U1Q18_049697, partial [Sarracenia purpurea var. burkii]
DHRLYQNNDPFVKHGNSTLIFQKIQRISAGKYGCRVYTDDGVIISNSLELTVKYEIVLENYGEIEIVGLDTILVIQSVEERYAGRYHCQVETDLGHIVSADPVVISVIDAKEDEIDEACK